jgi:hypothetical protein
LQTEAIHGERIEIGKATQRRGDKIDLLHVDAAVGTGGKMQSDPNLGEGRNIVVKIFRDSFREIAASQAAVRPL